MEKLLSKPSFKALLRSLLLVELCYFSDITKVLCDYGCYNTTLSEYFGRNLIRKTWKKNLDDDIYSSEFFSAASLGTFLYLKFNSYDLSPLNLLPTAIQIVFIVSYHRLSPLSWPIVWEVFSSNIKYFASCNIRSVC